MSAKHLMITVTKQADPSEPTTAPTQPAAKISIHNRRPLQERTVATVIAEAAKRGAYGAPVVTRQGAVDEVHLFRDGQLQASIFRPANSRLGVWREGRPEASAANVGEAVERALNGLRASPNESQKSKRKLTPTHVNPPISTSRETRGRVILEGMVGYSIPSATGAEIEA